MKAHRLLLAAFVCFAVAGPTLGCAVSTDASNEEGSVQEEQQALAASTIDTPEPSSNDASGTTSSAKPGGGSSGGGTTQSCSSWCHDQCCGEHACTTENEKSCAVSCVRFICHPTSSTGLSL